MRTPPLRDRFPGQSAASGLFYRVVLNTVQTLYTLLFRFRTIDRHRVPLTGPVIIVANHQSHLDPPAMCLAVAHRAVHPMARGTLFNNPAFGKLIGNLNTIPLKQGEADTAAIKEALRRLELGAAVLIFPEGSRTFDGALDDFQRGVMLIVRKAKVPVIPAAVEGFYDIWPRTKKLPKLRGHGIAGFGEPIAPETLAAMKPDEALAMLRTEIDRLRLDLRAKLRVRTRGAFPPKGLGDLPIAEADALRGKGRPGEPGDPGGQDTPTA